MTVNNFLADGGDSYSMFTHGTNRFVGEIDIEPSLATSSSSGP